MHFLKPFLRLAALALVVGGVLSACVEEGPYPGGGYRPLPPERPQFCSRQYDPVCATRGGDRQTFPNACQAEESGYRILRDGECRGGPAGGGGGGFCTRQYDPVCGRRDGSVRTFGNSCEADNAGARILYSGECRGGGGGSGSAPLPAPIPGPAAQPIRHVTGSSCRRERAPVCARRDDQMRTFANPCEAGEAGFTLVSGGQC